MCHARLPKPVVATISAQHFKPAESAKAACDGDGRPPLGSAVTMADAKSSRIGSCSDRSGDDVPAVGETGPAGKGGIAVFITLWLGQFLSVLATDVERFALRVWTFNETHSVAQFALITLCAELPALLFSPLAGHIVDRYNRKLVLIGADAVAACCSLSLAYLLWQGQLHPVHIYAANVVASVMNAVQVDAPASSNPECTPTCRAFYRCCIAVVLRYYWHCSARLCTLCQCLISPLFGITEA